MHVLPCECWQASRADCTACGACLLTCPEHAIVAGLPLRVRDETTRIEAYAPMVDHRVGEGPIRFGLPKGNVAENVNIDGFSDHFPVSVRVDEP